MFAFLQSFKKHFSNKKISLNRLKIWEFFLGDSRSVKHYLFLQDNKVYESTELIIMLVAFQKVSLKSIYR